jgi:hypothetical protein
VGGIVLMSTAEWDSYSTGTSSGIRTEDPQGGAGLVMLVVGIPMSATGTVLGVVGSKKTREYRRCLQVVAVNARADRHRYGLAVTCVF